MDARWSPQQQLQTLAIVIGSTKERLQAESPAAVAEGHQRRSQNCNSDLQRQLGRSLPGPGAQSFEVGMVAVSNIADHVDSVPLPLFGKCKLLPPGPPGRIGPASGGVICGLIHSSVESSKVGRVVSTCGHPSRAMPMRRSPDETMTNLQQEERIVEASGPFDGGYGRLAVHRQKEVPAATQMLKLRICASRCSSPESIHDGLKLHPEWSLVLSVIASSKDSQSILHRHRKAAHIFSGGAVGRQEDYG